VRYWERRRLGLGELRALGIRGTERRQMKTDGLRRRRAHQARKRAARALLPSLPRRYPEPSPFVSARLCRAVSL
jgi:hypothetical protein